jgi:amidase
MTVLTCDAKTDVFAPDTHLPYAVPLAQPFTLELADCFGRFPERDLPPWTGGANPITGPIRVEGVRPGDTIAVEILRLETIGEGFFGTADERVPVPIDAGRGVAVFPGGIALPLSPHVGTLGVAPAGAAVSTHDAGDHGGNIDCKLLGPGCVVCFAVQIPGAGLGLGDVHAVMGDGEVGGQGVETAAVATLSVRKVEGLPVPRPYGIQHDRLFVIGWGDSLASAADMAEADTLSVVASALDMALPTARKFLGMAADLRVCWRGGNTPCMRMELPLAHLPTPVAEAVRRKLGVRDARLWS